MDISDDRHKDVICGIIARVDGDSGENRIRISTQQLTTGGARIVGAGQNQRHVTEVAVGQLRGDAAVAAVAKVEVGTAEPLQKGADLCRHAIEFHRLSHSRGEQRGDGQRQQPLGEFGRIHLDSP